MHTTETSSPAKQAGTKTKVGIYLQDSTIDIVHALHETLGRMEIPAPPLWKIFSDLIGRGLEHTDLVTGKGKPQTLRPTYFGDEVNLHQFADDAELRALMDASWMLLWLAAPNNEYLHVNPTLTRYTGHSADDFLGVGWIGLIHPDCRARISRTCINGFRSRQAFRMAYRIVREDGAYGWIADVAQPRYRPDGRFAGYLGQMYEVAAEYDDTKLPDSRLLAAPAPVNGDQKS